MRRFALVVLILALPFGSGHAQATASGKATPDGNAQPNPVASGGTPTSYTYYTPTGTGWHDLGSTTAMQPNGIRGTGDTCPSNTYGGFGATFDEGCWNVMAAWGSGIVDQANRRMIVWGGGHADYGGNELYGLQIGATNQFTRYNGPSQPADAPVEVLADPAGPNARHTYGGIAYIAATHRMFVIGGALHGKASLTSTAAWTLDLSSIGSDCAAGTKQTSAGCTPVWTEVNSNITSTFTNGHTDQAVTDYYDSALGRGGDNCVYLFFYAGGDFGNYCPASGNTGKGVFKSIGFIGGSTPYLNGTIEQKTGIFVMAGNGELLGVRLPSGANATHNNATGCGPAIGSAFVGIAYDEAAARLGYDDILIYAGTGQAVYVLHTGDSYNGSWTCTAETLGSTAPPAGTSNGIFGRFRYMRLEDAFIYCPGTNAAPNRADCWSYRRR